MQFADGTEHFERGYQNATNIALIAFFIPQYRRYQDYSSSNGTVTC